MTSMSYAGNSMMDLGMDLDGEAGQLAGPCELANLRT
jgi:hypothetical protein